MKEKKLGKIYYADLRGLGKEKFGYLSENDVTKTKGKIDNLCKEPEI